MMALSTSRTRRVARALLLTAATLKAAAAATFSPGSLALLGVGDGATSLGSTVVQGAVYEVEPVNGTTVSRGRSALWGRVSGERTAGAAIARGGWPPGVPRVVMMQ